MAVKPSEPEAFSFVVEATHDVRGRGRMALGHVLWGEVAIGDTLHTFEAPRPLTVTVVGIERATPGSVVGLVLTGAEDLEPVCFLRK